MVSDKNLATSIGGKTARACDNCIRKRARWYCGADDAFLCQTCDASVHSANHLAGRHQRVRLKTASEKQVSPSWHHGFTRKARTPRHGKINPRDAKSKSHETQRNQVHHLVPDENSYEENEGQEQLLYRVPVFDPFAAELCLSGTSNEGVRNDGEINDDKYKLGMVNNDNVNSGLHGFYDPSSNMDDLEEFAVDVENLLGKGLDEESSFDMETLGFLDCREKESTETTSSRSTGLTVKKEEEEEEEEEEEMEGSMGNGDMTRETFELNLDDYEEEEEDNKVVIGGTAMNIVEEREEAKQKEDKKILLALDYEGVIAAWADQKSPWTNGDRPELDPNDCWPDFMDCTRGSRFDYGDEMGGSNNNGIAMVLDGGREARVSRYREKRRTRLFSKTIRYEVRKLNAEKRPRIKGRFVKRGSIFQLDLLTVTLRPPRPKSSGRSSVPSQYRHSQLASRVWLRDLLQPQSPRRFQQTN